MNAEQTRLDQARAHKQHWKRWGPYLSERQWGTVREDYSPAGTAWEYFPHDSARSRAYRWGEDGLLGISDNHQRLCFAPALWNGKDPFLKERLFGLTNSEGNHGEDVKEYYYYLDNTPTHSYMKGLYKYPQSEFPYSRLIEENRRLNRNLPEFELVHTGVFDEDRYFDVMVEYAKADADDILIRITVINRGPDSAALHLLPTLWFRNTWSWNHEAAKSVIRLSSANPGMSLLEASHLSLGRMWLAVRRGETGVCERGILSIVTPEQLRVILRRMLDESEFLGPYGIRSLSRYHEKHPYVFNIGGLEHRVQYEPAESTSWLFGGNSNWRGPVWMPLNFLMIEALQRFHHYLGDEYKIECPTGSGTMKTLWEISLDLSRRLESIFLRNSEGRRPAFGNCAKLQEDPHWQDHLFFHEYFHGDNGTGLGASHQTGWTGLIAKLLQQSSQYS